MKKLVIYYFLFLLSFLSLLSSGVIDSQDGFQYLAVARNIYYQGEPTAPPYEYDTRENIHMSVVIGKDGKTYSLTGLGFSLAFLPAVAITDMVYKLYGISPPVHFPLENDWLIFLTASFTNSFFGAMLGVILFLYLLEVGLSKKQALFISLVGLFATNLLVYTKHSFPHMMFISFLLLSFYLIRIHFKTKRKLLLLLSGISFGITTITYSHASMLAVLSVLAYLIALSKPNLNIASIKKLIFRSFLLLLGWIPLLLLYFWFENLRATPTANLSSLSAASSSASWLLKVPVGVLIEGLHGQLFSPGRSIFLYSPILLIPFIFWFKIKKRVFPELLALLILSAVYIVFFATVYRTGGLDQGIAALWHGENSWGPRYLTPLLPLAILLVGNIYSSLSKRANFFIFFPLVLIGLYVEILGIVIPYQTKLFNLQEKFFLNGTEYPAVAYSNFLPRYTPILNMSKNLIKQLQNFPKTFDHGKYNVKLYDGVDFPFDIGPERWRVIEDEGYISFDNKQENPVKELAFGIINHPITESSESAKLQFVLNETLLLKEPFVVDIAKRELIKIPIKENLIKPKNNDLIIRVDFGSSETAKLKKQILGLQFFDINGQRVNMESIDVPYISALGPTNAKASYKNWGGINKDPWKTWHIHTQMYERIPDFWWIRNLYYWDVPKSWILLMFSLNLLGFIIFGVKLNNLK